MATPGVIKGGGPLISSPTQFILYCDIVVIESAWALFIETILYRVALQSALGTGLRRNDYFIIGRFFSLDDQYF